MDSKIEIIREERAAQIATITRAVPVMIESTKEQQKLAREAKRVLGYSGLLSYTAGGRLQAVLESLEIEALDPQSVFEYQIQYGTATLSIPVTFFEEVEDDDDDEEEEDDDVVRPVKRRNKSDTTDRWGRVPISEYAKAIPDFVVNKAIQIKQSLPQVKLYVEELQKDPDPFLVAVFQCDEYIEEFYIEVWQEPRFEGRIEFKKK
jgi:hypothetical protein